LSLTIVDYNFIDNFNRAIDRRMAYSKEHKTLLQAIIHEGALHEDRGKELVIRLFGT